MTSVRHEHPRAGSRGPRAGQGRRTRGLLLPAALAASLAFWSGAALADDTDSFTINSTITARCITLPAPSGAIELGELAGANGFLDPAVLSGDERYSYAAFWCNAPVTITLEATALANSAVPVSPDPAAFTRVVDFTATLAWDEVSSSDASASPAATVTNTSEANTGELVLQVTALNADSKKLVAGPYSGAITVTFTTP